MKMCLAIEIYDDLCKQYKMHNESVLDIAIKCSVITLSSVQLQLVAADLLCKFLSNGWSLKILWMKIITIQEGILYIFLQHITRRKKKLIFKTGTGAILINIKASICVPIPSYCQVSISQETKYTLFHYEYQWPCDSIQKRLRICDTCSIADFFVLWQYTCCLVLCQISYLDS